MNAMEEGTNSSDESGTAMCLDCGATFPSGELLEHHRAVAHPSIQDHRSPREGSMARPEGPSMGGMEDVPTDVPEQEIERSDTTRTVSGTDPRMRVAEPERATEMESEGRQPDAGILRETIPDTSDEGGFERSNRPSRPYGRTSTPHGTGHEGGEGRSDPRDMPEPPPSRNLPKHDRRTVAGSR